MSVLQGLTQENNELKKMLGVISNEMIEQKNYCKNNPNKLSNYM
ncbi:hypothetical protein AAHB63_35285 [Bacillus thuringiensis]